MSSRDIAKKIIDLINQKRLDVKSAIDLVKIAMQEVEKMKGMTGVEKQKMVIDIIEEVAKGEDGVIGTSDDLIPKYIMDGVKALLDYNLVPSVVNVIIDASNGKLDVNNVKGCLNGLLDCFVGGEKS